MDFAISKSEDGEILIKKGEAGKFFGFSTTAGYRYLDYLIAEGLITPRYIPGVKTPRFYLRELRDLADGGNAAPVSRSFDASVSGAV